MWHLALAVLASLALVASAGADPQSSRIAPVRENVELVARLRLTSVRGGVGDVSELKGFAYVAAWNPECPHGGVHVVDIRDPARPQKVAFVAAPTGYYVGEGVHLLSLRSASFTGDVLLSNHEPCSRSPSPGGGGFSVTDVTEPRAPNPLSGLVGDLDAPDGTRRRLPNPSHSVQGWTDGDRAYAVLVDNAESQAVDIFEITDPRRPRQIAEVGLDDFGDAALPLQHGNELFFHDVHSSASTESRRFCSRTGTRAGSCSTSAIPPGRRSFAITISRRRTPSSEPRRRRGTPIRPTGAPTSVTSSAPPRT